MNSIGCRIALYARVSTANGNQDPEISCANFASTQEGAIGR
jgi:hypothetical protein